MAGIYIHIPFCKQACNYCDFHFSTSLRSKEIMLAAIAKELENRKNYLNGETIDTVYIGGGTPSILSKKELELLLDVVSDNFNMNSKAEITLEANPDDLTKQKLKELSSLAINRLSIGVQSFNNADLMWMNRAHNSTQVDDCLENAQQAGFSDRKSVV